MSPKVNINGAEVPLYTVKDTIRFISANCIEKNPSLSVIVNTDEELEKIKKVYPNIKIEKENE